MLHPGAQARSIHVPQPDSQVVERSGAESQAAGLSASPLRNTSVRLSHVNVMRAWAPGCSTWMTCVLVQRHDRPRMATSCSCLADLAAQTPFHCTLHHLQHVAVSD